MIKGFKCSDLKFILILEKESEHSLINQEIIKLFKNSNNSKREIKSSTVFS